MEFLFCDDIINNILSFVSIQYKCKLVESGVLTIRDELNIKKQELQYSKICCKRCSFDNIAIQFGLCTKCIISLDSLNKFKYITYEDANKLYKFSTKKLDIDIMNAMNTKEVVLLNTNIILYDRTDIELFVNSQFASVNDKLIHFYNKYLKNIKAKEKKEKSKEEHIELMKTAELTLLSKSNNKFITFYKKHISYDEEMRNIDVAKMICKTASSFKKYNRLRNKFISLENKLVANGLALRDDSVLIREYLSNNCELNEEKENYIVDVMEEMNYLFTKTNYKDKLSAEIYEARGFYGFLDKEDIVQISKDTKSEIFANTLISECRTPDYLEFIPKRWKLIVEKNNISNNLSESDFSQVQIAYLTSL